MAGNYGEELKSWDKKTQTGTVIVRRKEVETPDNQTTENVHESTHELTSQTYEDLVEGLKGIKRERERYLKGIQKSQTDINRKSEEILARGFSPVMTKEMETLNNLLQNLQLIGEKQKIEQEKEEFERNLEYNEKKQTAREGIIKQIDNGN